MTDNLQWQYNSHFIYAAILISIKTSSSVAKHTSAREALGRVCTFEKPQQFVFFKATKCLKLKQAHYSCISAKTWDITHILFGKINVVNPFLC